MNPKTEKPNNFGLDVIQEEVKRLQDRATTLQSKAIVRTDANVEKTGAVVDIIKLSTQNIQSMLVKELCPVMHETRNLVQERHWRMDLYANATRADVGTVGFVSHNPRFHMFPKGTYIVFGRVISFIILRKELSASGVYSSRRLGSISPE